MKPEHFGIMLDCSRNGVPTVESVKKHIDILSELGYNCLMLYTEDTYALPDQPYFGYLRGRYTHAQLQELDRYGISKGVELIPCIQTLAHLNAIVRWKAYRDITDIGDILLARDDKTYGLVEQMFATLESCFTSRLVHIGMDEAHMVGLGKYLQKHGYRDRFSILTDHLSRVCRIAKDHGFRPMIWSDMFFRLCNNGVYTQEAPQVPGPEVVAAVPKDVDLVYWNYYSNTKNIYDNMIRAHGCFSNRLWFAGGFWAWSGFAPKNAMSIHRTKQALEAAREHGIRDLLFTVWSDDGQETSHFAILPALYYTAQLVKGITDEAQIKAGFREQFGIAFDDFMLLDLPGCTPWAEMTSYNPDKYMFYNDCFLGIFDSTIPQDRSPDYEACGQKLAALADHPRFGYLFDAQAKLCRFLQLKYTIGLRTRQAYQAGDRPALEALVEDYHRLEQLLEDFYQAHKRRWFLENKPFGFEVQDVRIGGLKQRLSHCAQRLEDYLSGQLSQLEELQEQILPEYPPNTRHNLWCSQVSPGVLGMDHIAR